MIPSINITPTVVATATASTIVEMVGRDLSQYGFFQPPPPRAVTAQAATIQQLIEGLGKLQENWDGYGALPVTHESCVFAQGLVAIAPAMMPNPEVTPTSNGTIGLEWESRNGDAYLEIGRTRYSGHIQLRNGKTIYIEGLSANLGQEELAVIRQLLYASSGAEALTNIIQITEPVS
jgi:hypothetical protein